MSISFKKDKSFKTDLPRTGVSDEAFQEVDLYHICKSHLNSKRTRDHDQISGDYWGAA